MEAAAAVRLVCKSDILRDVGIKVGRLATDEDSTTHAAIANALRGDSVEKLLDPTHGVRIFKRDLYAANVPEREITYFASRATTALHANKNNPEGLKHDLLNMVHHAMGNHEKCRNWCKGKGNENYKHTSLPVSRKLTLN